MFGASKLKLQIDGDGFLTIWGTFSGISIYNLLKLSLSLVRGSSYNVVLILYGPYSLERCSPFYLSPVLVQLIRMISIYCVR